MPLHRTFNPFLSLVVYKTTTDSELVDEYYIESHIIKNKDDKFIVGQGQPLKEETIVGLINNFSTTYVKTFQKKELFKHNVIASCSTPNNTFIMWYTFRQFKTLKFDKQLNIPSGKYDMPNLLYIVNNNELSIFAFKGDKKPNEDTQLYHIPFFNITNGKVCLGSAENNIEYSKSLNDTIDKFEKMFWDSEFTSHGDSKTYNREEIWKHASTIHRLNDRVITKKAFKLKELLNEK